jgi:hypothetical protein
MRVLLTPGYRTTAAGQRAMAALTALGYAPEPADGSLLMLARNGSSPSSPALALPAATITTERVNAAEYRVHLEAPYPGVLVFREAFSPYWDANGRRPIQTDYYANGYLFDQGTYDFTLHHLPDTTYRLGLAIVVLGLAGLALALLLLTLSPLLGVSLQSTPAASYPLVARANLGTRQDTFAPPQAGRRGEPDPWLASR